MSSFFSAGVPVRNTDCGTLLALYQPKSSLDHGKWTVKMDNAGIFLFAFAMGLAVSGTSASAFEALANERVGFFPPFIRRDRIFASLACTMIAGPVMLFKDAVSRFENGALPLAWFTLCIFVAAGWALALGILVTELAWRAGILIT